MNAPRLHPCLLPVLLLLGAIGALTSLQACSPPPPAVGLPSSARSASAMPPWAEALAALAWPGANPEDLLFPAVLLPEVQGGSSVRCTVHDGKGPAPRWLVDATATPTCADSVRDVVAKVSEAGGVAEGGSPEDALTAAAICGDEAVLHRLVAGGADVNGINSCGTTALVAAAAAGEAPSVAALLAASANPNISSAQGPWSRSPLLAALMRGNVAIADELLRAGANPNAETHDGRSALMFAATMGDEGLVRSLLQRHANACHRDSTGLEALTIAHQHGATALVSALQAEFWKCDRRTKAAS